jgi:very-short-patch-repair endonuclease
VGRADDGFEISAAAEPFASPLRGEAAAQRRVRGKKVQPAQVSRARILRSHMTDAENRLWYHLRDRRLGGFKFVRQLPVAGYYADFVCREAMLIVEADGGQHSGSAHDVRRKTMLEAAGYRIIRFWNADILKDTAAVLEQILSDLQSRISKG